MLGAGLLARVVLRELTDQGWEVQCLCDGKLPAELPQLAWTCNLASAGDVQGHLQRFKPSAVINCHTAAALSELDCESKGSDAASRELLAAVAALSSACEAWSIFLVHVSSDAVFSGAGGAVGAAPFSVDAEPQPCTPFGWRSLTAEQEVLSRCSRAAVLRVPLLYGPVQSLEECAVTCRLAANRDE